MNKFTGFFIVLLFCSFIVTVNAVAQNTEWIVGMRTGLSIATGGQGTPQFNFQTGQVQKSSGTSAGFQFGPTGEIIFDKQYAVVEEFNINTQSGTPIEWGSFFKYYFEIPKSEIKPYADLGFSLWFVTGGPYVGIPFGGGAMFPVAKKIYIPADVQFGPLFANGSTVFAIEITTGIRFELP